MRKLRSDSIWNQLTTEQISTLDDWLFTECLSYAETLTRLETAFGIKTTMPALCWYYRRRRLIGQRMDVEQAQAQANALNQALADTPSLRSAVMKLARTAALELTLAKEDTLPQFIAVARLLLEGEKNELQRLRLDQADREFQYQATTESIKDMPRFQAHMAAIEGNKQLSDPEKIQRLRKILFAYQQHKIAALSRKPVPAGQVEKPIRGN